MGRLRPWMDEWSERPRGEGERGEESRDQIKITVKDCYEFHRIAILW